MFGFKKVLKRLKRYTRSNYMDSVDYSGFFRALVLSAKDPMKVGRVKVWIPDLMEEKDKNEGRGIWAYPTSLFFASNRRADEDLSYEMMKDVGSLAPPPDGTFVYIFFENSDFNRPRYLPFGPALIGGEPLETDKEKAYIPQENRNQFMSWFKWLIFKSPFGRAIFVSDDPHDAGVFLRGYNRTKKGECKSPTKNCNYSKPEGLQIEHCGEPQGEYDKVNKDKAHYHKNGIANYLIGFYEGFNDEGETHDFLLNRDYRHNFIKLSSTVWEPSPDPPDYGHANESKAHIEWAAFEHEKSRDIKKIERIYNHANIKWILNTENNHADEDDKFEFSEENISYMAQMPDWVDQELNGHRLWLNFKNGNPCDYIGGSGNINVNDECIPDVLIDYDCDCKWRSEDSHKERRGSAIIRSEHLFKIVVGDDTPSDESLFTQYHSGDRFIEFLFNGEFLVQDKSSSGKGFIELFPCNCTKEIHGVGDSKFYMRLADGHSLWESVRADSHIEFIPEGDCECNPKGITHNFLTFKENGQLLWQSKADMFIEQVPMGKCSCSPNGNGHTFYRQEENGHIVIQSKADMFIELRPTGANSCPLGIGENFLLIEENGHMLWKNRQGSYIEFLTNGDIIINSVAGGGNIYEN